MSWLDMLTLAVAALSALECVTGRLAAMHWREHRQTWVLGYLLAAGVCILAGSLIWQGQDSRWLDAAAWAIAVHLALSWGEWRNGPPPSARRDAALYPHGAVPSRIDGGDNPA